MKLDDLFERAMDDAEKVVAKLKTELKSVNDEITKLKSKGTGIGQGAVAPQYKNQYDRLLAKKKDLQEKIKIENERAGSTEKSREWEKGQTERRTKDEDTSKRRSEAMSAGMKSSSGLRKKYGDWAGLAKHVKSIVDGMTDGGKEKLHGDQIEKLTDKLGVTPRTLYKWLERSEFSSIRRSLPSEW